MLDSENQVATGGASDGAAPVAGVPLQAAPGAAGTGSGPAPAKVSERAGGGWPPLLLAGIVGAGIVGAVTAKVVATAVQDTALTNLTIEPQTLPKLLRGAAALLVVALAAGLLPRRPWAGWPLAALGSALVWVSAALGGSATTWPVLVSAIGAGVALAGTANAVAGTPDGTHRRVLGGAVAVGFVAAGELTRLTHWNGVLSKDALAATVITALLAVYVLATARTDRTAGGSVPAVPATADAAPTGGGLRGLVRRIGAREPLRTAALLVAASVVTVLLDEALRQVNLAMRGKSGLSARRYQAVELATHYGHIAIVLVVTGGLVVLAWRAGGYVQARWIALGAGLAALLYSGPDALGDLALSPLGGWATLVLPVAAAAGAAVVWYLRGTVPWDAYALLIGALATIVASALPDDQGTQHTSTALAHMGLIAFAFALGAAVSDVAAPDARAGVGVVAGFGTFVLAAAQFAVDPLVNVELNDRGSMYGAVAAAVCGAGAWVVSVRDRRRDGP